MWKNKHKVNVLHAVFQTQHDSTVPFHLVRDILQGAPELVEDIVPVLQWTPIHFLCCHPNYTPSYKSKFLKLLFEALKKISTERLKILNAYLPTEIIHDAISLFVGNDKRVLMREDCGGDTALGLLFHDDVEKAILVKVARPLLQAAPDAIKVVNKKGFAPIHSLVHWIKLHPDENALQELIDFIPKEAFQLKGKWDSDCLTPLNLSICPHVTSRNIRPSRISFSELELIIDAYPGALLVKSEQGLVPIQFVHNDEGIPVPSRNICEIVTKKTMEQMMLNLRM